MLNFKKIIVVTGGAGFVGSNLIKLLINKTKFIIILQELKKTILKIKE
jgi:nucleoside-diphosphate-sugar epimerase